MPPAQVSFQDVVVRNGSGLGRALGQVLGNLLSRVETMNYRIWVILLALIGLGACASPGRSLPPIPTETAGPYRLDSGDQVRVIVFGQPDLSGDFRVNDSGNIAIPLIGAIQARSRSTQELEQAITSTILANGLLVNPSVSVEVQTYRPFFILGEVRNPGQYPYVNGMTVSTAIAIGGGFTFRAEPDYVSITRQVDDRTIEGRAERNTLVRPGDVIYVFERYF